MLIDSPALRMWGRFEHALDDKGRVIIPQRFRETLGSKFVLTIGPDHHIRAYPMPVWEALENQLISASLYDELDPDLIFLQRMFGNCEFVSPDREFRLSIPRHFREWAGMEEGDIVVIIGSGTRLEIWSRAGWRAWSEHLTEQEAGIASRNRLSLQPVAGGSTAPTRPTTGETVPTQEGTA
ncbi:MAG TPA: division/cell wall cluster transcriptional repressor MraZ [Chthonomonas sp.]|jgi:MraZ protein|uniref:division/cell wall cluster transcriptional repressor MraZ n=1 Tax=Chthonomonas sp. TaxID=2282153 RepID=UPI002B4B048B|nr:division/cell wall cluster transcriptional repressor MraZ [Chthonomonas sp.]HLH81113.1 division/cell wall cluster transcriptional repressor MraZ [Chthonomonas sp.]